MSRKIANATGLYMEGIRDGRPREAVAKYTGDRYTQHSTGVRDGREGFIEFFEPFLERNPVRDIRVVRAIEDGPHVFLHVYQSLNDGESEWVTTDFFDTDADERIVEHWDVIAPYAARTPSGHTSVDGPTEVTDLDRTEANKAIVRGLISDVLMAGADQGAIDGYISAETFIQHNAEVEDGLAAFKALVLAPDRPVVYDEIVLLVGQGNFVASLCRARWHGAEQAQVDLFRLEDGLVVEHWDNVEPVPPENEWANSGKF
jgi:predicted SnoaL-like aldol condensation-catalyzing enzyme